MSVRKRAMSRTYHADRDDPAIGRRFAGPPGFHNLAI